MNFLTVCYIFTTFTLEIRWETKYLWLCCNAISLFHRNFPLFHCTQLSLALSPFLSIYFSFSFLWDISQSNATLTSLPTDFRFSFGLANEGRKVLVDLSAKINSLFVHFIGKWEMFVHSRSLNTMKISFYALYIIPTLAVLSTVCNLIVFLSIHARWRWWW